MLISLDLCTHRIFIDSFVKILRKSFDNCWSLLIPRRHMKHTWTYTSYLISSKTRKRDIWSRYTTRNVQYCNKKHWLWIHFKWYTCTMTKSAHFNLIIIWLWRTVTVVQIITWLERQEKPTPRTWKHTTMAWVYTVSRNQRSVTTAIVRLQRIRVER